jgi:8-oxo-dGTP pyrophosphatase MutT (NUDIX family)
MFHQCKLPIISYGVIVFRSGTQGVEYLMIRRKNSFGFIDFIRGKYLLYNLIQLKSMIDEMSLLEKEKILTQTFESLWNEMWGESNINNNQYKNEELASKKKFELLRDGITIDNTIYKLEDIVRMSNTSWRETEWEFPKGRRNQKEKDLDCALREFGEETGISENKITVIDNIIPFEETFIGSNHKSYKHKYFLAVLNSSYDYEDDRINNNENCNLTKYQETEVSKVEWKTYEKCLESIRPYNLEKKAVIENINKVIQEYRFYS